MKKISYLCTALVLLLSFTAGCGKAETPEIPTLDYDISVTGDEANNTLEAADSGAAEPMHIKWGWGQTFEGKVDIPADSEVIAYMNDKFGVVFEPVFNNPSDPVNEKAYDIFITFDRAAYAAGLTRSIPREMIERYAPRYAEVMTREPFGWELNKDAKQNAYSALSVYDYTNTAPVYYAAYRLDWLESLGISPNGAVSEIGDRMYFTDQAFTQDQFVAIMRAFRQEDTYGMALPEAASDLPFYPTLLGMWGLGTNIVEENGAATYYYATAAYRDFLQFMAGLYEEDLIGFHDSFNGQVDMIANNRLGWWNDHAVNIAQFRLTSRGEIYRSNTESKLLITPPEISASGQQGARIDSSLPFNGYHQWVISAAVSDEKLAKILSIYDTLSFDREFWVAARYGFEGTDYDWTGEPYESRVDQPYERFQTALSHGTFVFHTYVFDGVAGKQVYEMGQNALLDFMGSDAGRRLTIPPYKEDITGEFQERRTAINQQYGTALKEVVQDFYKSAITGQIDIGAEWDGYLARLNDNGYSEITALINQYPAVGR